MPIDVPPERRPASPQPLTRPVRDPERKQHNAPVSASMTSGALACNAALLFTLVATAFATRMHTAPLFGKAFGAMWFHFGAFIAVVTSTLVLSEDAKSQRHALLAASLLQAASALGGRAAATFAARSIGNPMGAAALAHGLVSYPMLGLAGAVWLEWAKQYTDPEVTWFGQQIFRVFSCIALVTVVKILDPVIWETVLSFADVNPRSMLIGLSFGTLLLSVVFTRDHSAIRGSSFAVHAGVLSVLMLALAADWSSNLEPAPPFGLEIAFQRYSPAGLVQVVDVFKHPHGPGERYLRLDASVLGSISYGVRGAVVHDKEVGLLDAARLLAGSGGKQALVIGLQSGSVASSLIAHGYNTTIVESRRAVYDAARSYMRVPEPATAFFDDAPHWVSHAAGQAPLLGEADKFDVVVHDLFEAGEMPSRAFTMEFWEQLRELLRERGVVAVRYIGRPKDKALKSAANMLHKSFGACKIYHANTELGQPQDPLAAPDNFAEFVFYCTPATSLYFRPGLAGREVSVAAILDGESPERYLLRETDPILNHWGRDGISDYWKLMREQHPPGFWSTY